MKNTSWKETKAYKLFEDEVKKYEKISIDDLWNLIRRFTQDIGRDITAWGSSQNTYEFRQARARGNYYKFWIIRLESKGIIKQTPSIWWDVIK